MLNYSLFPIVCQTIYHFPDLYQTIHRFLFYISVYKYKKDSDETFSMKIAKLNLHSIKKKSSRMRGRLSTNLGIGLQVQLIC